MEAERAFANISPTADPSASWPFVLTNLACLLDESSMACPRRGAPCGPGVASGHRSAEALIQEYGLHDDPPQAADALIAAAAIETGRAVVTENWRDFHFIDDLRFLDIRGVTRSDLPVIRSRNIERGGPVPGRGCCRRLKAVS